MRQRKNLPDPSAPRWVHWFRAHVYFPFNRICWQLMGMAPIDYPADGSWSEGQQSFIHREDAEALMRSKGPGWYVEETPLHISLPDESCTFGDTEFQLGDSRYDNGTTALPVVVEQRLLEATESQIHSMIEQTGRMLNKNRSGINARSI